MKLIVAVDQNWGIGCNGRLLAVIPADMQYFREKTLGKVVVMGRKTFESLPGKKPLQGRINIVLTRDLGLHYENVILCNSLSQLFSKLSQYASENVFIIGGESVYEQCMPYCSEAYVTKIRNVHNADTCFLNLDNKVRWKCIEDGPWQQHHDVAFKFTIYKNLEQKSWEQHLR